MTDSLIKLDNFAGGAHNCNTADRLPEGFFRHAVNLDPVGGGKLQLRAGYSKALDGTAVRGALALGDKVLLADGADLVEFDTRTNSSRVLRSIAGAGDFAGAVHNGELYFCTANESLRYDGSQVRRWGVPTMPAQPAAVVAAGGAIIAGTFAFAATFVDESGLEGGTGASQAFVSTGGQRVTFTLPAPPAGGRVRLYIGRADSTTLYLQHEQAAAGAVTISGLRDDTATLEAQFCTEPPQGHLVASYRGQLLIAAGSTVWVTQPLQPHLVRRATGFFQYPEPVTVLAPTPGGVFVVADKHYFLSGAGSEIQQRAIDVARAVAGSQAALPGERAAWMTEYGPVVGNADGSLQFLTREHYAPDIASHGRSTVLERAGNQLLITTQRGIPRKSGLAMGDFVSGLEVTYP